MNHRLKSLGVLLFLITLTITACSPSLTTTVAPTIQSATLTPTIQTTPTIEPTPVGGGSHFIIISTYQCNEKPPYEQPTGVLKIDLSRNTIEKILDGNSKVEALSPDNKYLLVSKENVLLVTDLNGKELSKISEEMVIGYDRNQRAGWLADGTKIYYIAPSTNPDEKAIFLSKPDGTQITELKTSRLNPITVIQSLDLNGVYFDKGYLIEEELFYIHYGSSYIDFDGNVESVPNTTGKDYYVYWLISPDNNKMAFEEQFKNDDGSIDSATLISDMDGENKIYLVGPKSVEPKMVDFWEQYTVKALPLSWSPDGTKLLVRIQGEDENKQYTFLTGLFDTSGNLLSDKLPPQIFDDVVWSADGNVIAFTNYYQKEKRELQIFDINKMQTINSIKIDSCEAILFWLKK